jgi:hypothetical protein
MKSKQIKRIGALERLKHADIKHSKMFRNHDPIKGTEAMRVLLDEFRAKNAQDIAHLEQLIQENK